MRVLKLLAGLPSTWNRSFRKALKRDASRSEFQTAEFCLSNCAVFAMTRDHSRRLFCASAASHLIVLNFADRALAASPKQPLAVFNTGWTQKSNWKFGTGPGNNVARFTDWLSAGWYMNPTPRFLNKECETYNTMDNTANNANFQAFADHCDIVAIWNGQAVASAQGNGSISSLLVRYNVPDGPGGTPSAIGYYELTCKVPSVGGAWPAWWTIGHPPGAAQGAQTWGPEIDIFEFTNTDTKVVSSTLHKGSALLTSYCFMKSGTNPPNGNPPASPKTRYTQYDGSATYNCGSFSYAPGTDFSQDFHRFGLKIDSNYNSSIWVDDVLTGVFATEQYCDDVGHPVSVQLIVNLAVGDGQDPIGSVDTSGFGGAGNAGPNNRFRLGIRNIQIWRP